MTDETKIMRPQPGDIIVYTTPQSMSVGQVWELKDSLKQTFPDNPVAIVMQGTVGYRFEAFTEDELSRLSDLLMSGAYGEDDADPLVREVAAELERRAESTKGAP